MRIFVHRGRGNPTIYERMLANYSYATMRTRASRERGVENANYSPEFPALSVCTLNNKQIDMLSLSFQRWPLHDVKYMLAKKGKNGGWQKA